MKLYQLDRKQILPVSLEKAWQFFSSPFNLPSITPPWLNFSIVGEVPNRMFPGMLIRYRLTPLLGIPMTWISEITHVDHPRRFIDEQRMGPYSFWHHQHHFRPVKGGIEMIDTVSYAMRYGPFGTFIHSLLVKRRLEDIFEFRRMALERIFPIPFES